MRAPHPSSISPTPPPPRESAATRFYESVGGVSHSGSESRTRCHLGEHFFAEVSVSIIQFLFKFLIFSIWFIISWVLFRTPDSRCNQLQRCKPTAIPGGAPTPLLPPPRCPRMVHRGGASGIHPHTPPPESLPWLFVPTATPWCRVPLRQPPPRHNDRRPLRVVPEPAPGLPRGLIFNPNGCLQILKSNTLIFWRRF